jgi:polyhydroxyalkanoate synthesis regulator phasin
LIPVSKAARRIVRYRNRKLYEAKERRFVTIHDVARAVASGERVEVVSAESGEDITARILSRALASEKASVPASTDTLTRLLRAGSEAASSMAEVVERAGAKTVAAKMREAAAPERLAETFAPLTRRLEDARQDVERIVGGLVERGRLTWDEGTRLREDVGLVFRNSLRDVVSRVRDLTARIGSSASPELSREIADLRARLDQLEAIASASFARNNTAAEPKKSKPVNHKPNPRQGRPAPAAKKKEKAAS